MDNNGELVAEQSIREFYDKLAKIFLSFRDESPLQGIHLPTKIVIKATGGEGILEGKTIQFGILAFVSTDSNFSTQAAKDLQSLAQTYAENLKQQVTIDLKKREVQ